MKIVDNRYSFDRPKRRPLKIYASDPMAGKSLGNRARVDIKNEPLQPGPVGERLAVVDYNAATGRYYPPIDLDDPNILMQGGLDPTESDPRFHQQMVYAVAIRTLENFDRALGRQIYISRRTQPLRLFPHAFYGANAFFDPKVHGILFGYFRADAASPGANLPGQTVFTCLSHDIIAHEMTHAIVHRLRKHFLEPSNLDVLAFHEAFADLVALFQHFSFSEVLRDEIQRSGSNLRTADKLLGLAQQFGHATATGTVLRSGIGDPSQRLSEDVTEPHMRGAILLAAVFDAFIRTYENRTRDLLRLAGPATVGAARELHPDLVTRLANEAARIAQSMLTICIRAFDYMPPVDVTFGDFLRALVTADMELSPDDELGQRAALIEGFRLRGIYPEGVTSLAEESLVWDAADEGLPPLQWQADELLDLIVDAASRYSAEPLSQERQARQNRPKKVGVTQQYDADESAAENTGVQGALSSLSKTLWEYARDNGKQLMLDPDASTATQASGVHPVFRVAPNGRLVIELIAQVTQRRPGTESGYGGMPERGGTTLIVDFNGNVKYAIAKPLPAAGLPEKVHQRAVARLKRQSRFVELSDLRDPSTVYMTDAQFAQRSELRARFAALHLSR